LRLHELVHWHENGLLGSTKPADQLVAYIGEPGDGLKVVPDAFVKVCLRTICIIGALPHNDADPFGQAYVLKILTNQAKQQWTIVLLICQKLSQNLRLEIGVRVCEEVISTKLSLVRRGMTCNLLSSFLEGNLNTIRLFLAFFSLIVLHAINTQRHVFCALIRSDIVTTLICLSLDHAWIFIAYLLDRAGISSGKDYYNSDKCSSRKADWSLEYG
jgi:hypothetical protein